MTQGPDRLQSLGLQRVGHKWTLLLCLKGIFKSLQDFNILCFEVYNLHSHFKWVYFSFYELDTEIILKTRLNKCSKK